MAAVVIGYVSTPEGYAALRHARREAALRAAKLVVVNSERGGRDGNAERAVQTERELEEVRHELEAEGLDHDVRHLARGNDPAEDLLAVADEVGAELVVIGLRRRTPVGKLIMGSNAQRILLDAHCAVLAVKAD